VPHWTTEPDTRNNTTPYSLLRTPIGRPLVAVITTDQPLGCRTHFYLHRTVPCEMPSCPPCADGYSSRWHCYLGVYSPKTGDQAILELTANAAEPLLKYYRDHSHLRGVKIKAERRGIRTNSPVVLSLLNECLDHNLLPPPPDLKSALAKIWGLPANTLHPTDRDECSPQIAAFSLPENENDQAHLREFSAASGNGDKSRLPIFQH
jgi:hypothetical protein